MSDASGTAERATMDRELSECTETIVDESGDVGPSSVAAQPVRLRWVELASLFVVLAVIIAVCRGIQNLLGI